MYDDTAYNPDSDPNEEIANEDRLLAELLYADGYDSDPAETDWNFEPIDIETDSDPIEF